MLQIAVGGRCKATQDIRLGKLTITKGTKLVYMGMCSDDHPRSTTGYEFKFGFTGKSDRMVRMSGIETESSIVPA